MKGLTVQARENGPGSPRGTVSPRADVGEIDTRAPFQSVKAAVTLFGEVVSPRATTPVAKKSKAEERVLEKETQHHMMLRERDYYIHQLRSAEAAKAQASRELKRANATLHLLKHKLEALNESKQASTKAAEEAKIRAKELEEQQARRAQLGDDAWKVEVNNERECYKATTAELIACKQELSNLKQDFDAALVTKTAVFQKVEEAEHKAQMDRKRHSQLSREVDELKHALEQVKLASLQAKEEFSKAMEEKEKSLMSYKLAKEDAEKEIKRLQEEYEPVETLQQKLEETMEEIRVLQEQMNDDYYVMWKLGVELDTAKKALEEAVAEETSLRCAVDSLKTELEEVKKKLPESETKTLEAESAIEEKQAELEKKKAELETAMSGKAFVMQSSIEKVLAEAEKAKHETEDSKKKAKLLKKEAKASRSATKEAEEKLKAALKEAEAAKATEKLAEEQLHNYSRSEAAETQGSGPARKIRLSVEEFDSMNRKIEESKSQADLEVATANAQVEAIYAREKEVLEKLEVMMKENEATETEIKETLKRAENAEAAKRIVERELQKWRQNEKHGVGKTSKRKMVLGH